MKLFVFKTEWYDYAGMALVTADDLFQAKEILDAYEPEVDDWILSKVIPLREDVKQPEAIDYLYFSG
jgi:hypothetical protein